MEWYYKNEYIQNFDEARFVQSNFQTSLLNRDKLNPADNFGILYDFEIETIKNYTSPYKPLNNSMLLLLLAYIRAFTWSRGNNTTDRSNKSPKYKPEVFHSQFQIIEQFTGISRKLVSRATDVLEVLGLVKTYRPPKYKDEKGNWHTDDIFYVCPYKYISDGNQIRKCNKKEYDWEKELNNGIDFAENKKYLQK